MNYKKIEEKIDNKFRDLFELFDKAKIVGKTSTIIMYGNKYCVDCSIKPIIENLTKHNSRTIQSARCKRCNNPLITMREVTNEVCDKCI